MFWAGLQDLKQKSYRFYLAALLCPPVARAQFALLLALHAELALIPARVTEPMMGVVRATWWRDSISNLAAGETAAHPLQQQLSAYNFNWPLLADFAETFDAPFIGEELRAARLRQRAEFFAALVAPLLGVAPPLCFAAYRAAQDSQFFAAYQQHLKTAARADKKALAPLSLLAELTMRPNISPAGMAWRAVLLALGR